MKSIMNRILVVMLVGALTSVVALAKVQKHKVTFENDIKVNGTLVKKGTYEVKFDDETGQLSIVKDGKTVAQAMAKLAPREKKANDFQLRAVTTGEETSLVGITFGGSDKDVVISNSSSTTGSGNN